MPDATRCCHAPARPWLTTDRIAVVRCTECGSLWSEHLGTPAEDLPWYEDEITAPFLTALARRRERQADVLVRALRSLPGPILDYGCGQGVFFDRARRAGLDVWATDLSLPPGSHAEGSDRFVALERPWSMPAGEWRSVVLLDVLEHHPDPAWFLTETRAGTVIVKTPLLSGPLARLARCSARLGRPHSMESLFLVGESNPHRVFFTTKGLTRTAAPRRLTRRLRLAEVGTELPERVTRRSHGLARLPMRAVGAGLGAIGPVWSDTGVFVFESGGS